MGYGLPDAPTVGLVDLGSNSVRLLVFRINQNKSYTVLTRYKQMVRLGEGSFETKRLGEEAMTRTIEALRSMAEMCRGYNVQDIVARATAAVRDAGNSAEFKERAFCETRIRLEVISGMEEARLIHLGVSTGLSVPYSSGMFVDIGGGSTEIIVGSGTTCLHLDSLKLGCVRVMNAFPETAGPGPVSPEVYEKIRTHVRNSSLRGVYRIRELAPDIMVGSSGTIQNLAEIASKIGKNQDSRTPEGEAPTMSRGALADVAKKLCALTLEERKRTPGINPQRADIIIAGAAILQTLMDELGMPEITVSSRGLLEGMLQDYLARGKFGYLDGSMSTREQSVLQLAGSCAFNERHTGWVERITAMLFDSAGEIGLHSYGDNERELLKYASWLHDIGLFLSFDDHHAHSRYMIKNSDLLGFNQREINVMANATYFHRKWSEKKNRSDEAYNSMSREDRNLARTLGAFLRLGEGLDRSQLQTVTSARFSRSGRKVRLNLVLSRPSPIEVYSTERAKSQFRKVFGTDYTVTAEYGEDS
ncbi:MAG: Ppx/GppA family phosphatase [Synergistaceae bacterium]|jgi:exopolyphosphatase/guanosine-5'-triphosphate,3'-diphosphate pyrophosphatase|nr:Ppx/GppA family phosphatase [Synergistaceae bacterium]